MNFENNAPAMKTVVETYVIEETQELIYDNDKLTKWNEQVAALGLEGQKKIVKPEKSPIPFLLMNRNLQNVFAELCPRHVEVSEYDKTPIPVEVLDLIALSVRENYFPSIQVWSDEKSPDPAVIGLTGYWEEMPWYDNSNRGLGDRKFTSEKEARDAGAKHPSFEQTAAYLIARWADVKQSFAELSERAKKRYTSRESSDLNRMIRDAKRKLDDLESEAEQNFAL